MTVEAIQEEHINPALADLPEEAILADHADAPRAPAGSPATTTAETAELISNHREDNPYSR